MKHLTEYIIPFSGMKIGKYEYDYKIGKEFFDAFEYSEIKDGDLSVSVSIEKSETMMLMLFDIKGTVFLECDLCLGNVKHAIENNFRQIFKFTDEEDLQLDDEITFVNSSMFEVNIAPNIVEFINLSKPNKVQHNKNECNEDITSVLNEYLLVEKEEVENNLDEDEIDPRWNALKKLKNNK